ncbi:MAG: FprA family A-type flavoprotein [Chitinivibrionales bacterium]|nr:FprA family A-type flavoprotein [Chitinivibrionales bacterium]
MQAREIAPKVALIGAVDWDRRLFDSLIPLPDGTSYNSYLVRGSQKTALIDTVDPAKSDTLMEQLAEAPAIDYIVANHAEQDHSGSIGCVLDKYKNAVVVCTPKCKDMLVDHLRIDADRIRAVSDGETLALGDKTLEFVYTPWVHWPETMVTYLREDNVLFSCDFFGSHLATNELFATDEERVAEAAKRYYAEIMMPFRTTIKKNIEKVQAHSIALIAPSHGPVYNRPAFIIDAYKEWISDTPKNVVVIPYISMHGSTRAMVDRLVAHLTMHNIVVHQFDLAVTDIGKLAIALVDAATIVIGAPTVHVGPHPTVLYAATLANALRPKAAFASVIGSYGWSTKALEQIAAAISHLKVEILEPVLAKGYPRETDFVKLDALADAIAQKHSAAGLK